MSNIAKALCRLQSELKPAKADSENPHFQSKYADLTSVWESVRDLLTKNGLAIAQTLKQENQNIFLVTTLMHESGEKLESFYPIILDDVSICNPQKLGSAITYARRFSLAAILGVTVEDDDGNTVTKDFYSGAKHETKRTQPTQPLKSTHRGANEYNRATDSKHQTNEPIFDTDSEFKSQTTRPDQTTMDTGGPQVGKNNKTITNYAPKGDPKGPATFSDIQALKDVKVKYKLDDEQMRFLIKEQTGKAESRLCTKEEISKVIIHLHRKHEGPQLTQ